MDSKPALSFPTTAYFTGKTALKEIGFDLTLPGWTTIAGGKIIFPEFESDHFHEERASALQSGVLISRPQSSHKTLAEATLHWLWTEPESVQKAIRQEASSLSVTRKTQFKPVNQFGTVSSE